MDTQKEQRFIPVETLYRENEKRWRLELLSGKGSFQKRITEKDLHRPGLALAGFTDLFTFSRVQICGNTEVLYLNRLTPDQRRKRLRKLFSFDIPCVIVTENNALPSEFVPIADEAGISVFRTPFATTKLFQLLGDYLDEKFAPTELIHGSMVDVYGIGVLITGRSGIGKSEVALDLVSRGHRLVADDIVTVVRRTSGVLIGKVNETLRYHMEIRGLGIIDIHAIFGIRGIRKMKKVEVQVELVDWEKSEKYERLGLEDITVDILGEKVHLVRLPIYPGKNISMIVEVIALNELLKIYGYNAAEAFENQIARTISGKLRGYEHDPDYIHE
ncbi:MAG: HPr(Ser) kinase/phosphatase [bacterium]|nr:HPr(Ser) kinase/phosphatase [bacterium]